MNKALKNIYRIIMECGICYEKIEEYKYFKMGCCSLIQCLDCAHHTNNGKCPQCKQGYKWVKTLTPEYEKLLADHSKLIEDHIELKEELAELKEELAELKADHDDSERYYNDLLEETNELRRFKTIAIDEKLKYVKKINEDEKYMNEMVQTIYKLIAEKELKEEQEAENEKRRRNGTTRKSSRRVK